jgi:ribonuclease R
MLIDKTGQVIEYRFYPVVIRSQARITYSNVAKILQNNSQLRQQYAVIVPHLENLHALHTLLATARQQRGALSFARRGDKYFYFFDKKNW